MGHRASKINFNRIIGTDFDLKITFPMSIRVRNVTFDRFLKIFGYFLNFKKMLENTFFKLGKKSF